MQKKTGNHIKLRVCYSDLRIGYNCSVCTKCQRTMLGIILCGENPNDYGFNVPPNFYDLILKNFGSDAMMTTGVAYEWKCLQEKAQISQNPFVIKDAVSEKNNIGIFTALPIAAIISKDAEKKLAKKQRKHRIIGRFPKLFNAYLKIRRQF